MDQVLCAICGHEAPFLGPHLLSEHNLSLAEFQQIHPASPTVTAEIWEAYRNEAKGKRRKGPSSVENVTVTFAGLEFPVNLGVPEEACLPWPTHYRTPQTGAASQDAKMAAVSLRCKRSMYIHGLPGTGKDAFFHAYSAETRTPAMIFSIQPGVDIQGWFFSRAFSKDGTFWEEGAFLKAARDGYLRADGTRVPYMLLITDFDRADRSQAEALRLVLDSISGRVLGPTGEVHKVLAGTQICATANTSGGGDVRGRMISAHPLDASIMDRFNVKLQFKPMEWVDEEVVCRAKFPVLVERAPDIFTSMGKITTKIREAIAREELQWEMSHRAVCNILQCCCDLIFCTDKVPTNLLGKACRVFLDGAPDPETRDSARKLMDAHIAGGTIHPDSF